MKKITTTTLILLTLILSGCFAKPQAPVNQNQNTNTAAEEIDTSDWQTYRNEEYGFEFKYPATMGIKENSYYLNVLFNDSLKININILNDVLNPKTIKSPIGIVSQESLEELAIDGKLAYRFRDGDAGYGGNSYRISLDNSHTLIMWFVTENGYYINDERLIISTFRFIEK